MASLCVSLIINFLTFYVGIVSIFQLEMQVCEACNVFQLENCFAPNRTQDIQFIRNINLPLYGGGILFY